MRGKARYAVLMAERNKLIFRLCNGESLSDEEHDRLSKVRDEIDHIETEKRNKLLASAAAWGGRGTR